MNRRLLFALGIAVAGAIAILLLVRQQQSLETLRQQSAAAQAQSAEADRLRAEVERLTTMETELKRLQEENRELPRLRGEVARLRRDLAVATNQLAKAALVRPVEPPPPPAVPTNTVTFSGTAHASLAPGQTLVMGGWPLESGKRTLALFQPSVAPGAAGSVIISGMFVQVPETVLAGPGWEAFQAATHEASSSAVFEADQAKAFMEALRKMEGVDVLSSPRLATASGTAGSVSVGEPNGNALTSTLLPVLAADGLTVELTVSNSLQRLVKNP